MQKKSRCPGFTLLFDGIIPICIAALTAFACISKPAVLLIVDFDYFQGNNYGAPLHATGHRF